MEKDIIIIGGGPGGYVAAIRSAQLGAKVCLIEKDGVGGTCLHRGCIPTKALYKNAEILNTLKHIEDFGINVDNYSIDVEKVHKRKQAIIAQLSNGINQLLKANNVEVINGTATLKSPNTVDVCFNDGSSIEISCKKIIIATGSKPAIPPIEGAINNEVYTSEEILNFSKIPKTLAVIGGGVVGMELACIFNALGTKVTVIEFLPNILNQIDSDITKRLNVSLKKRGIDIFTSSKVTKLEKFSEEFVIFASGKKGDFEVHVEKVLLSTGRLPVLEDLNLNAVGIDFDKKGIKVNSDFETSVKNVYAIGDVTGGMMLAHVAAHQGIVAAEKIMGHNSEVNPTVVPSCIFIFPEIATVGISEDEAKDKGIPCNVSKFMFGANGKALTLGEGEGFIKVLSAKNINKAPDEEAIIGVHIMGPHASDLIHEGALAISNKLNIADIKNTVHAHPTLSESFSEAVLGLIGEAIHLVPPKNNVP